jgi:hypothetical protein
MAAVQLAYGSFGDILSTIQITIQIAKALYDPEGSVAQRSLVQEVNRAQQLLVQIQDAIQPICAGDGSVFADSQLCRKIHATISSCHETLKTFDDRLQSYKQGLAKTKIHAFWTAIYWSSSWSTEIDSFRQSLASHMSNLSLLFSLLDGCVLDVFHLVSIINAPAGIE